MIAPTHKPIIDYFESLNTALKDFPDKSFFRMDLSEIKGGIRSGIKFPCMTVESPDGNGEGSTSNSSVAGRMFAFTIYMNPKQTNYQEQNEMIDQCEQIGKKILSRMRLDNSNPDHLLYGKFSIDSCRWHKVGPIFTQMLYGYRFTGLISGTESFKVNKEDWEDLETVC